MRRVLRWTRRIVLALLLLMVLGAGSVLLALHTDWGRDKVRAQIEAKLKPYFPAGARIGRLEGSVLGDFTLHDIELIDREGRKAVTIRKVTINVDFGAYFDSEYRVEQLVIDGVRVALHQQGSEPPNVATMFQPNPDPLPANVIIEHLAVRDADITIEKDGRIDHLDDLTVDSAVFLAREGPFATEVRLSAMWRERMAPVKLSGAIQNDVRGLQMRELRVAVGEITLDGRGLRYPGLAGLRGQLKLRSPAGALHRLAPELDAPREALALDLEVRGAGVEETPGGGLGVSVRGSVGKSMVDGVLVAHPLARQPALAGTLHLHDIDASIFAGAGAPKTDLDGAILLSVWLDEGRRGPAAVRGMVALDARGQVDALRFQRVTGGAALDGRGGELRLEARGDGDTSVDVTARLAVDQDEDVIHVVDGRVVAHSRSLGRAAQGHVAVRGSLDADLRFDGHIGLDGVDPDFEVHGRASGHGLRYADFALDTAALDVALVGLPTAPGGTATVAYTGGRAGTTLLPNARIQVRGRRGGDLDVTVEAVDGPRDLQATVAATVRSPDLMSGTADVRLRSYDVRGRGLRLQGTGGRALLTPERLTISGVRGTVAGGTFSIDGSVPLPMAGAVGARGEIAIVGVDLATLRGTPGLPSLIAGSVSVRATLDRGRATLDAKVSDPKVGELVLGLEVIPPRRALEPAAWFALDRRAIKALHLDANGFDLAAAGKMFGIEGLEGRLDGALHVDGAERRGEIKATGVVAAGMPAPLDATVELGLDDPAVTRFHVDATLRDLGRVQLSAGVRVPIHIFDPDAWRRVGVGAIDDASLRVDRFTVDKAVADRFGLGDVRGELTANLSATRGLATLDGSLVVSCFTAGPLREPLGVMVEIHTADGTASAHAVATLEDNIVLDLKVDGELDVVRAARRGLDPARIPIKGTITIPEGQLAPITRALGQSRRLTGKLHGAVELSGTVAAPIAEGELVIEGLGSRVPRGGGAPRGGVRELKISGRYDRGRIVAGVRGRSDDEGTFALDTKLDLARPEAAASTLVASKFQLRPIARLVPDVLFGVSGVLDADLRLAGIDPKTAVVTGEAQLSDVTLPINDVVGVLRNGKVTLDFDPRRVHAVVGGALEAGRIDMVANATLEGMRPIKGDVKITARGIELITATAPRVDGKLTATIEYKVDRWVIEAVVRDGVVRERSSKGRVLHPSGAPPDVVFASTEPGADVPMPRSLMVRSFVGDVPEAPFAEIELNVEDVSATTELVRGDISGKLNVAIGKDGATIKGKIEVARGDVEVYARRYRINQAIVTFDGGVDPLLNLQLERELPQLTLRASITGRYSDPQLLLSSDPPNYTQGQLLSFALSDSAAAPGSESVDAATNLFAAVASQTLVDYVKPYLPVDLDVIAYEPPTASSSAAYVAGKWLRRKLLVLYRSRPEARANENVHEAEAEYWINRRILLEATGGNKRVFGADILWTKRW